jgi:hypothetical protein
MNSMETLRALPMPVLAGLGALLLVQVALDVIALLDLYRRPADQVATGKKWLWVVIIVFVNTIGAILYLAIGRKPAVAVDVRPSVPSSKNASEAADLLYGKDIDPR